MTDRNVEALIAFIDSRQTVPWAWGTNDCVSYALAAVEAETGVKVLDIDWTSNASALRTLKRYGSLEAAFDAHFERVVPAFAKRGDIAGVADEDFGIHPMVVEGDLLVIPGERGNRRCKRLHMVCAWSAISVSR